MTPKVAGGTRSYEMARRLVSRGHSVTMVCGKMADLGLPATRNANIRRGSIDGIDVVQIDLPYGNEDGILKRAWTFVRFAWISLRLALKEDYDLLFATSTPLTAGVPGVATKMLRRKEPFIFEVRDLWPELPKALGMRNPALLGGMSLLEYLSYRYADACIGLSPGICKGIARRSQSGKRIVMIPNGCDLELFRPKDKKDLSSIGVGADETAAIFTGAHGIANGLDAVLDAAAELLRRDRPDIRLVFIGNGREKRKLVDRASRDGLANCLFLDPVPKVELKEIVASADVGLMILANVPAFYYGTSPNKFFDYIASGIPVLNNYPGWLADVITKNDCGTAVPPDDPVLFADALISIADDPRRREKMGENARGLAEREFSRDELGADFVNILEEVSHSHGSSNRSPLGNDLESTEHSDTSVACSPR